MFVLWLILAAWWLQQFKRVQSYTLLPEQAECDQQSSTKSLCEDQPAHSSTVSEQAPTVQSSEITPQQDQPDPNSATSPQDGQTLQSEDGESVKNPEASPENAQPVIPPEDAEAVQNPETSPEDAQPGQEAVTSAEAAPNPALSPEEAQPANMSSQDGLRSPSSDGQKHLVHFDASGGSPPTVESSPKQLSDLNAAQGRRQSNILLIPKSSIRVIYGDMAQLPKKVRHYVEEHARLCKPETIHICDGSDRENELLLYVLQREGILKRVTKMENCWLAKTDPADVARVERLTYISTTEQRDTIPTPKHSARCQLGNWMSPEDMEQELNIRFPNCMRGRTMFVIPFSMGPVGSPLSKIGIQLTDSEYVVASMRIMTRIGDPVLEALGNGPFVKCLHSVGKPLPLHGNLKNNWPCDPKMLLVAHLPEQNEICSFGSSYGGNALLGKKCLALRLGSILGHREGWLAEHMLILGVENTKTGQKKYIVAAFPSACGKTNLAMMKPTLPHLKVTCVGDDIAWMRFDDQGRLRAINPENGFFGVAPGTSYKTNPYAMDTIMSNTIFTNVAETSDGGVFWEGLEEELPMNVKIKSWLGDDDWSPESRDRTAAHPNSRFCTPAAQCPIMDPAWEDPEGVPIDAIIFGGRRPLGVPLVYETFNWEHGVFTGASMRSESTAAAEHKAKIIMNDPFAMRPFFGYNFGDYLRHWLSFEENPQNKLPKVFHVNWFRKDKNGKFLWPGFGENCRVLDWIMRRVDGQEVAQRTPVGFVPKPGSLDLTGLDESQLDLETLMSTPSEFWENEVNAIYKYFDEQVNDDLPELVMKQLKALESRVLGH